MSAILALDFLDAKNDLFVLEISEDGDCDVQKVLKSIDYKPPAPDTITMSIKIENQKFTQEEIDATKAKYPHYDPKASGYLVIGEMRKESEAALGHLELIHGLLKDPNEAKALYEQIMSDYRHCIGRLQ